MLVGRMLPSGESFVEAMHTQRLDGGMVSRWRLNDGIVLGGRFSVTNTNLDRIFGNERVVRLDAERTVYGEEALSGTLRDNAWVLGIAFQHDGLSSAVQGVGYSYNAPGFFAQDEFSPATWLKLAASARVDHNNANGTFFSPRFSALIRQPSSAWSLRASVGGGYAAPRRLSMKSKQRA